MYCPNCGKTNSTEQKFCRSCGLSLDKIAQSVVEQLPAKEHSQRLQSRQQQVELWLTIILGGTFSIFVGAIIWMIIYKIIIVKGEILGGLILIGVLLGLIVSFLLVIYRESLLEARTKRNSQATLPEAEITDRTLSESRLETLPSVTERTTELLTVENRERSKT